MEAARHPWPALGVLLIRDGLVTPEELEEVLARQGDDREHRISSQRLGEALVEAGTVTSAQIARLVAEQHELPFLDLEDPDATVPVENRLPEELARLYSALPVRAFPDGSVLVVVADPTRAGCFDDIRRALGVPVRFAVATPEAIGAAIDAEAARIARLSEVKDDEQTDESAGIGGDIVEAAADDEWYTEAPEASERPAWPVLGSLLVRDGLVSEAELEAALAQQRLSSTRRLGEILVARGSLTEAEVSRALAEQHELSFIDLRDHEIDFAAASRLPLDAARAHVVLPISTLPDGALLVAVADPASMHSEELRTTLGVPLQFAIAPPAEIDSAIDSVQAHGNGEAADEVAGVEELALALAPAPVAEQDDEPDAEPDLGSEPENLQDPETLFELEADPELQTDLQFEGLQEPEILLELAEPKVLLELEVPPELEIAAGEPEAVLGQEPAHENDADLQLAAVHQLEVVAEDPETVSELELVADDSEPETVLQLETDPEVLEDVAAEPDAVLEPEREPEPGTETELEAVPTLETDAEPQHEAVFAEIDTEEERESVTDAIERALALGATAVHFVPRGERMAVLGRVDGVLSELEAIPPGDDADARNELAALTRRPLHTFQVGERSLVLRSAVLPTLDGDRATFRVVDEAAPPEPFLELVVRTGAADTLQGALDLGSGLLVVCGPAGSGRTTTVRAALADLGCAHRAVMTIEDPVEQLIPGADQTEVDPSRGLTFASGLRAILRSDPDVVVVGELVDPSTASLAARAALDGRLVLTTLEAESTTAGVRRLLDLGLEPHSLAHALTGVVAQRLVARVCVECRESYYASAAELTELGLPPEELGRRLLGRGQGCNSCDGSGYAGQVAVFEVLPLSEPVRALVTLGATAAELEHSAVAAGMRTLFEDVVELCLEGVTTPAEVRRIAGLYR
jgi:type II secretory ATPase GspE/PulE/Tfp pilus assembly ATPase PilB-like protein